MRSRTSARLNGFPPQPGTSASITLTSAPSPSSRRATRLPMKPSPPVTSARLPAKTAAWLAFTL